MRGLSLVAASGGHSSIAVHGPLTIMASLVVEHRLQTRRLSSCGSRAQLLRGMWDLPRPGLEPASPALAGRFSTTAPPGKPQMHSYSILFVHISGVGFTCVKKKKSPLEIKVKISTQRKTFNQKHTILSKISQF